MKNLLVLWIMALMLVFLTGGSAVAEVDPILDGFMDPTSNTIDEGTESDDHPWGGEQSPAVDPDPPTTRPLRVILTTGIVPVDQFLNTIIYGLKYDLIRSEHSKSRRPSSAVIEVTSSDLRSHEQSRTFIKKGRVAR